MMPTAHPLTYSPGFLPPPPVLPAESGEPEKTIRNPPQLAIGGVRPTKPDHREEVTASLSLSEPVVDRAAGGCHRGTQSGPAAITDSQEQAGHTSNSSTGQTGRVERQPLIHKATSQKATSWRSVLEQYEEVDAILTGTCTGLRDTQRNGSELDITDAPELDHQRCLIAANHWKLTKLFKYFSGWYLTSSTGIVVDAIALDPVCSFQELHL